MSTNRVAYYIDATMQDEQGRWVPCVVEENEPGYTPTNYAWPVTLEQARAAVDDLNNEMGLTPLDKLEIVSSSMRAQGVS